MTAKNCTLTQNYLKEILHYSPNTGIFTWKARIANCIMIGEIAGYLDKTHKYIVISISGKLYRAHRLAFLYMTGSLPVDCTDHINHIRHDNRWENLRHSTRPENNKNVSKRKDNTSGITGVYWSKNSKKWISQISTKGKILYLGSFDCLFDAACIRKSAENKYNYHYNHGV